MAHEHWNEQRRPDGPSKGTVSAVALGLGAIAAGAALGILASRKPVGHPPDDAPELAARHAKSGDNAVVGRTVMINKPRTELYAFWRDFQNLPRFMENIEKIRSTGENRMVWTIAAPAWQSVDVETEIVEERENELIAWRSVEGSQIDTQGRIAFKDAPNGRGTLVEAIIAYKPPGGELGRMIAKLFGREPNIQGRREMKRFKMLMETGEIATAANHHEHA
jgi:uncharacterized membrane protein